MPKNAASHIQKTAPGPPVMIAADTPAILPTPTVAASAVQSAWNCEIEALSSVCPITFLSNIEPMVFFIQCPICVTWKNFVSSVRSTPVAISSHTPTFVQTNVLIMSLNSAIFSIESTSDGYFNKNGGKCKLPLCLLLCPTLLNNGLFTIIEWHMQLWKTAQSTY